MRQLTLENIALACGGKLYLPKDLTSIGESAFRYCTGLSSLSFTGTKTQWNNITKSNVWYGTPSEDPDKSLFIGVSVVHCTDGDINI